MVLEKVQCISRARVYADGDCSSNGWAQFKGQCRDRWEFFYGSTYLGECNCSSAVINKVSYTINQLATMTCIRIYMIYAVSSL